MARALIGAFGTLSYPCDWLPGPEHCSGKIIIEVLSFIPRSPALKGCCDGRGGGLGCYKGATEGGEGIKLGSRGIVVVLSWCCGIVLWLTSVSHKEYRELISVSILVLEQRERKY